MAPTACPSEARRLPVTTTREAGKFPVLSGNVTAMRRANRAPIRFASPHRRLFVEQ
jgi:hypothetical protein